ncbi:MAG: SDR family oxidoreductase [Reichenbachiella sp.]|uniref:SDR family oxidoreductase n=1 Tax=Reichenbachiella sp. TaxID=2184521 RepID=UPI0032674F23
MEFVKGKKILVTGGAGFIGSNLCEKLLKLDHWVYCLDNFSTGRRENIAELLEHPKFILIEGDIRTLRTCSEATEGMDYVFHEAALGSVPRSIKDPITTNEVNITGFLNMLMAAKEANVTKFIYAASSSTYGDSTSLPKVEDQIGKPLSPYAITKYVNELYADIFHRTYGLNTVGLRYFNVFGRNQDPDGGYAAVIPKFIKMLIQHESPVINGDGSFSRDFTYIENVVQMNLLAMSTDDEAALNQVYNTAFGERNTLNDLIDNLKELLSQKDPAIADVKIIYGPDRIGDIPHSLASIDKAQKLLGYAPKFDFKSGLKHTIDWYWGQMSR